MLERLFFNSGRSFFVSKLLVLILSFIGVSIFFGLIANGRAQTKTTTDLNLVLAIDSSYSVNKREFDLQVQGIVAALTSQEVVDAIRSGPYGRIGLSVYQWAGPETQNVVMPWTMISSQAEARGFAAQLLAQPRKTAEGVTAIGSAISFAVDHLAAAPFATERQVIDVQADGPSTWSRGLPIRKSRDLAVAQGIVVNGLPIMNEVLYLDHYFENHVIGGAGAFIEVAKDYEAFAAAIKKKLLREIKGQLIS